MGFYQLLVVSVTLNVTANLLLKKGVISFGGVSGEKAKVILELSKAAFNPFILIGLILYGLSFMIWLRVLSFNDLSKSYPIFATCVFILTTIGSIRFLNEQITLLRIAGIAVMLVGIFIVSRS
jgi:multidrug transporter EmrE-like cation transporter